MDLFAARLIDHNVGQEGDEFGRGVPHRRFTEYFASLGVEGSVQRQGAVTKVFKTVPFGASWDSGRTRSLRSRAWMEVFSSTLNTAACAGGFRYNPIMSAAFFSKSGSFEATSHTDVPNAEPGVSQSQCRSLKIEATVINHRMR